MEEFVVQERVWMVHAAIYLCHNRSDAEDLVQEAILRALRRAEHMEPEADLHGWFVAVMTNAFLDSCRSLRVRRVAHERIRSEEPVSYTMGDDVREDYDGVTVEQVLEAARTINPTNRASFDLRHRDGLSYDEIARVLNLHLNTVKTQIRRARDELAARFGRKGRRGKVS